jgi:hypothetical protein
MNSHKVNSCHMNSYLSYEFSIYFLTIHLHNCLSNVWRAFESHQESQVLVFTKWCDDGTGVVSFVVKLKCIILHTKVKFSKNLYPEHLRKMSVIIGNEYCSCLMTLFSQCELLIQRTLLSFFGMVNENDAYSLSYCGAITPSPRIKFLFESLQMDSRYWVRHRIHRLGIWINVKVYLLCGYTSRVSSNIFLFSCSTQSKSAF